LIVPGIDRLRPLVDLREKVVSFPPQPVITEDNLVVNIDSVIYFQVTNPKSATYEIEITFKVLSSWLLLLFETLLVVWIWKKR
jgi:regulator of protease activity HflC (stomatin/prohibitin superfamily)